MVRARLALQVQPAVTGHCMCLLRSSIFLVPLMCAAASHVRPARHFSYSGSDPSRWTSSRLASDAAVASTDFTVFPCDASSCTVARAITDANRDTYVVGSRYFQTQGASTLVQTSDVFVAELDPTGATVFLATLSGKGSDQGLAIALDP